MPNDHQADVDQVIRDLIDENPDLPIRADFYRGVNPHRYSSPFADPILRELVATPGCPQEWFVRILPGVTDVVGEVAVVQLPQTSPGVVDVEAVQGSRFHVELLAAIREKAAVVEQMRAAVAS
jgi:hypothetical protein